VGSPNVGKSVLFHQLTGRRVMVANYPGSTVEVTRARARVGGVVHDVVDTPGMYSLVPISDEERVARRILLDEPVALLVQVVDAKNLERMLPLTLQLLELGLPMVLCLNVMDEADQLGIEIDVEGLATDLGVPVVPTVAIWRRGIRALRKAMEQQLGAAPAPGLPVTYDPALEQSIEGITCRLPPDLVSRGRAVSLLLLQRGKEIWTQLETTGPEPAAAVREQVRAAARALNRTPAFKISRHRQTRCRELAGAHVTLPERVPRTWADRVSALTEQPLTGVPILLLVLYLGLYKFVGQFGAGTLVDLLESRVFGAYVNPWIDAAMLRLLPAPEGWQMWGRELVGGHYGLLTMGVTYAIAIVLPIVSIFFLFFALLEDTGYFPRLAMLVDRVFKHIGLNGRAIIPLVLGLGCNSMGTIVTRIQETRRERLITGVLLAMAIPCSAQFGVITALLSRQPSGALGVSWGFVIWALVVLAVFVTAGRVISRALPGETAGFYMELPPMRLPLAGNVLSKAAARTRNFLLEILPLFLAASAVIWVGRITGLFDLLVGVFARLVRLLDLPASTGETFLYGFFRRDLGAADLFRLADQGLVTNNQMLVACVTLTLFMPCIAQLLVMKKVLGGKTTAAVVCLVFFTAFGVGALLNQLLNLCGVTL